MQNVGPILIRIVALAALLLVAPCLSAGRLVVNGLRVFANSLTAGPDGDIWFTGTGIGRITPAGGIKVFTLADLGVGARSITSGPGGKLWFAGREQERGTG